MIPAGLRDKLVSLENPGGPLEDGSGGFTEDWTPLSPAETWAHIDAASSADMERLQSGTIMGLGLFTIQMLYHPQVSVKTRITYADPDRGPRLFQVVSLRNPDEARRELIAVAAELLP